RQLSDDELKDACPKHDTVQNKTNLAAKAINPSGHTPSTYGTAVHLQLRDRIRALKDPKLRTEVSLLKTLQETGKPPRPERQETEYGTKGSIRVDVLETTDSDSVCVYDIKTGERIITRSHCGNCTHRLLALPKRA